jgi:S1-C subfamily serine protease
MYAQMRIVSVFCLLCVMLVACSKQPELFDLPESSATVLASERGLEPSPIPPVDVDATVEARVQATISARDLGTSTVDDSETETLNVGAAPTVTPESVTPRPAESTVTPVILSPTPRPTVPRPSPTPSPISMPSQTATPQSTPTPTPVLIQTKESETVSDVLARISSAVHKVRTPEGTGSAVAIGPNGLLLTNYHVVSGGNVTILFDDGSIEPAIVIGFDQNLDLAVISIDIDTPTFLAISSQLPTKVGDGVLAIGYPLGGNLSVTEGIVSAFGIFEETQVSYLQTDAAVNPGNSGGALVDLEGHLLGIVTSRYEFIGGRPIQNVGFAVDVVAHADRIDLIESGFTFAEPSPTPVTTQKFGSSPLRFTIYVPVDWYGWVGIEDYYDEFQWKHRFFRSEDWIFYKGTSATAQAAVSLRTEEQPGNRWTNETYMDRLVGEMSRPHIILTQRSVLETRLISGQDALRFEFDVDYWTDVPYSVENKGIWKSTWIIVTTSQRAYALEAVFFEGAFGDQIGEEMERIISTFEISN